jgi:hypothetical protein
MRRRLGWAAHQMAGRNTTTTETVKSSVMWSL